MKKTEQKVLLQLARATIVAQVHGQSLPVLEKPSETLLSHSGCFVTIKQQGQLRGCIGSFVAAAALGDRAGDGGLGATVILVFTRCDRLTWLTFSWRFRYTRRYSWFQSIEEIQVGRHGLY